MVDDDDDGEGGDPMGSTLNKTNSAIMKNSPHGSPLMPLKNAIV